MLKRIDIDRDTYGVAIAVFSGYGPPDDEIDGPVDPASTMVYWRLDNGTRYLREYGGFWVED